MTKRAIALAAVVAVLGAGFASAAEKASPALSHKMDSLTGKEVDLSKYLGNVVLVVNVASECGLTPQYNGLQALHDKYAGKGLRIVGFPCNQFGSQEPGSAKEIKQFCEENYGVKFDMMSKIEVNGEGACDLYKYLTSNKTPLVTKDGKVKEDFTGKIHWNFEKFLIDRDGNVVKRFHPRVTPESEPLVAEIEQQLEKK